MPKTNDNIYELMDRMRREIKADVQRLESKVEALQGDVGNLKTRDAVLSTRVYSLTFIIVTTMTALYNVVLAKLFKSNP